MNKTNFDDFFSNWKKQIAKDSGVSAEQISFIKDGIIDFDIYNKISPKILFILKDAYSSDKQPDDFLLDYLNSGAHSRSRTWINASKWIAGIHELYEKGDYPPFKDLKAEYDRDKIAFRRTQIKKIALINLNKSLSPKSKTNKGKLETFSEKYSDEIIKEIELCNPDIIILGGTRDFVTNNIIPKSSINKKINNRIIVEMCHPAATTIKRLNLNTQAEIYENLMNLIQSLK